MKTREKRIKSGKILEVQLYPVTDNGRRRDCKHRLTSEAQKRINHKNKIKKLQRLIEANFKENEDYYLTLTYRDDEAPRDYAAVHRNVKNYFDRLRRIRVKAGLPELKYIYVIECTGGKRSHLHWNIHIIINGGIDRLTIKKLWKYGDYNKVEELVMNENGFEALAKYFTKEYNNELLPKNRKLYNPSRNLIKPTETINDNPHIARTCSGIARIAKERVNDFEYWERKYKGYRFIACEPKYNEFNGWWYIFVRMCRDERISSEHKRKDNCKHKTSKQKPQAVSPPI